MNHRKTLIVAKGTIKATCVCGWQTARHENSQLGREMVNVEYRAHRGKKS